MDLLSKFDAVKIEANARISDDDRAFCKAHQSAYDNARTALLELGYFWADMEKQQKDLLPAGDASPNTYLASQGSLRISKEAIREQISNSHSRFIRHLATYFSNAYHFSVSPGDIEGNLLPCRPPGCRDGQGTGTAEQYLEDMQNLSLHYTAILDQIFLQTGGRELNAHAVHQLKKKCRRAVWSPSTKRGSFQQKKSSLQFTNYACYFREWRGGSSWELSDGMKDILRGAAHFETGGFTFIPKCLSELIGSYRLDMNEYSLCQCQKLLSLKMFKNGRADIKFANEEYAREFMDDYLGTTYEAR